MLSAQNITYIHPDKELLFKDINFSVKKQEKIALIGNNGAGKSTFLKIIAGILRPSQGAIQCESTPYYIPQHFGQFNDLTIASALQIEDKLNALHDILHGNTSETNLILLNDDWTIEERCFNALFKWNLQDLPFTLKLDELSGGEKTKLFLAGILIHNPQIVLLDEPTNHLDHFSREILYSYVKSCDNTLIVVSHDRVLLDFLNPVYELDKNGLTVYGGNYSFYKEQKEMEENALFQHVENKEKELKTAKRIKQESIERKLRQNARGKRKQEKENLPRVLRKTMRNKAEETTAKIKKTHTEKIGSISEELKEFRAKLPEILKMKLDFNDSTIHTGKTLINAQDINFRYDQKLLWDKTLSFRILSGERINIRGKNGSGKSTLIKLMLGDLHPACGVLNRSCFKSIYVDQDYSLIKNEITVYEQAQLFNYNGLQEHDIKLRLSRYLFDKDFWNRPCGTLSGGEKMRIVLCCLMICENGPDLFVLDEPTNNLDIQNIEILASAVNEYAGTVIVVSHDISFIDDININRIIEIA